VLVVLELENVVGNNFANLFELASVLLAFELLAFVLLTIALAFELLAFVLLAFELEMVLVQYMMANLNVFELEMVLVQYMMVVDCNFDCLCLNYDFHRRNHRHNLNDFHYRNHRHNLNDFRRNLNRHNLNLRYDLLHLIHRVMAC
jgi:hypothetical protein